MLKQARAHVPTAARCLAAALHLDTSTREGAAGAGLLAHAIDDLRALRAGMVEEE